MKKNDPDPNHLEWLVENRALNQRISLKLYKLLKTHAVSVRGDIVVLDIAQDFVGANFSLWRAVFLSDCDGTVTDTLDAAEEFLGKMTLDNAINYPQDRNAREWTFLYYLFDARHRLNSIAHARPDIVTLPPVTHTVFDKEHNMKSRWVCWQTTLGLGVDNLAALLESDRSPA